MGSQSLSLSLHSDFSSVPPGAAFSKRLREMEMQPAVSQQQLDRQARVGVEQAGNASHEPPPAEERRNGKPLVPA
jgi:hypothetical protein